jgi:hypothetical protein
MESFEFDETDHRLVRIPQAVLDNHDCETARQLIEQSFDDGNDGGEQVGKRRYSRGYKSGDSE